VRLWWCFRFKELNIIDTYKRIILPNRTFNVQMRQLFHRSFKQLSKLSMAIIFANREYSSLEEGDFFREISKLLFTNN